MKYLFLLTIILLNCQVGLSQEIKDSRVFKVEYVGGEYLDGTSWYVNVKINKDSVTNPDYMRRIFDWKQLLADYSPEEVLLYQDYEVSLAGLGDCYVHEMRFTEWHALVQKKVYYVASPLLNRVFIFNFQNVEFVNWHLFLCFNLRGHMNYSKVHYSKTKGKFIVDEEYVFRRNDDDFNDDDFDDI